ncbi:replication initiator protein A [Staphylococcus delphini]|uniref:replication initiator protein A n=1 Tax=Staphylococcus delphini TaxID=53344 RepID=UPI00130446E3|nr:replication initiator protein A [Staphylococcus delphini]
MAIKSIEIKHDHLPYKDLNLNFVNGKKGVHRELLIFGRNGTGKSTIANTISDFEEYGTCEHLTFDYKEDKNKHSNFYTFSEKFVDSNIKFTEKNDNLNAIVMFDKQIDLEKSLEMQEARFRRLDELETVLLEKINSYNEKLEIEKVLKLLRGNGNWANRAIRFENNLKQNKKVAQKVLENDLKLSNSSAKKYKRILVDYELITTTNKGMHIYVNTPELSNDSLTYADGKKLSYFHMPKFFDTNPNYKNASLLTKLVYTLQKERFTLTLTNVNIKKASKYLDDKGRIFCIYANQELARMLNVCEKKIIDVKKELMALGLLKQKKQGINEPNRLYLYTPLHSEQLSTEEFLEENKEEDNTAKRKQKFVLVPPEKSMKGCLYKVQGVKNAVGNGLNMQSSNTDFSNTVISNTFNSMYSMYLESSSAKRNHMRIDIADITIEGTIEEIRAFRYDPIKNYKLLDPIAASNWIEDYTGSIE